MLVLNLGPAWGNSDAYKLFQDNVIEIAFKEWESPPGLGICPLDVVFSVCHTTSSWLAQNDDHVVVSCTALLAPALACMVLNVMRMLCNHALLALSMTHPDVLEGQSQMAFRLSCKVVLHEQILTKSIAGAAYP